MNIAMLQKIKKVHIEQMRPLFEKEPQLENDYRRHSKKGDFTCIGCGQAVSMNLPDRNSRVYYFRHIKQRECVYEKNEKRYERHVSANQDVRQKDLGLTLFKEILEGMVQARDASLSRGYLFNKELSFVPDFIIEFKDSSEKWTVDYMTNAVQGFSTGQYASHLKARKEYYASQNFRSFFFIDDSWYTFLKETSLGTLTRAEAMTAYQSEENDKWDTWIQFLSQECYQLLEKKFRNSLSLVFSESIRYVDIQKRSCRLLRYLPHPLGPKNQHFYPLSHRLLPLEQALTISKNYDGFSVQNEEEEQARQDLQRTLEKELLDQKHEAKRLEQLRKTAPKSRPDIQPYTYEQSAENDTEQMDKADEETERIMEQRIKIAMRRPIEVDPTRPYTKVVPYVAFNQSPKIPEPVTIHEMKNKWNEKDRKKVYTRWIEYPIEGTSYISNPSKEWKDALLRWINSQCFQPAVTVHLDVLLDYLESEGIIFLQKNRTFSHVPVKSFLTYYQKELKKEFKFTLTVHYIE